MIEMKKSKRVNHDLLQKQENKGENIVENGI